jgi:taurine dioxygenase
MMRFEPVSGAGGADVYGIDLTQPLTEDAREAIHQGLLEHLVLFFREQKLLAPDRHVELASHFGEPMQPAFRKTGLGERNDILVLDQTNGKDSEAANFHADNTFRTVPPLGAILQAHIVPERGGDTCFASMYAAYDALSPHMKRYLEGLEAYHSYEQLVTRVNRKNGLQATHDFNKFPPVKHPIAARHPETGRKLLFVNYNWTTHIDGVSRKESESILKYLCDHILHPEFQIRMRWKPGDVVFWDNRSTQHYAVPDFEGRRLLHRVAILPARHAENIGAVY